MRFFRSRVSERVYASRDNKCLFFVTSESSGPGDVRRYSVRRQCGCDMSTVGAFQGHTSLRAAKAAAKKAAAKKGKK